MIRASLGSIKYWDKWISYRESSILEHTQDLEKPSGDPSYRPQYFYELVRKHFELMLAKYSRGDSVEELIKYFDPMLTAWETSIELGKSVYPIEIQRSRRNWNQNLGQYIKCFWVTGLAMVLKLEEPLWQRLLAVMGNEGEDALLDRIIATRQPGRPIGQHLCHPKPYARLLSAIDAPVDQRSALLRDFVANWYLELDRPATKGRPAMYNQPYWYGLGDTNLEGGAYFGRWCVEAAAAVQAFGLDDSLCLQLEHYPAHLLHPDLPDRSPADHQRSIWADFRRKIGL
jgi:Domain of unknown function (DUF1911)/Domain of unknown function (DUF1910)